MKNHFFLLIIFLNFSLSIFSQKDSLSSFILKGTVVNGETNELLIGANILINLSKGTKTNEVGNFIIQVQENDSLKITYIGYKTLFYNIPYYKNGEYLTKFKLYKDSVSLDEIEIFPWPTYDEFKKAFLAMDKQNEKIKMEGVKMYEDRIIHETYDLSFMHLFVNPASYIYDKLFDKKAKLKRRLDRRRKTISSSVQEK